MAPLLVLSLASVAWQAGPARGAAGTWVGAARAELSMLHASAAHRCGMLCVGLSGNNGVTLVAAQLSNQRSLAWESDRRGPQQANLLGCITQVGTLAERYTNLAQFSEMAIGGWDIRELPLGQGLYESRILDYDLVRQLREEMDQFPVLPGVWDASFIGDSQHKGATYTVPDAPKAELLKHLRKDISEWRAAEHVDGHVTVMWSASVERPSELEVHTAEELIDAISRDDPEVSPSLLYATAAVLEGCSFVNGGSQNTLQPGLVDLAARQPSPVYVLGTDFKAGQTKAKTAIVEYLRALGLRPQTIASYNHLGNNDMRNLLSPRTWTAKARVKADIFEAWVGDETRGTDGPSTPSVRASALPQNRIDAPIDHKVAVLFAEAIGDEKRDTVEYTSSAFMGCEHTMLTYTRCMDSALCVPLMIDAAVFCDHFAQNRVSLTKAAQALSYLFKVNEGSALGVDPGFFAQSAILRALLESLCSGLNHDEPATPADTSAAREETEHASAPQQDSNGGPVSASNKFVGSVACIGLVCLDMQLIGAEEPSTREAIAKFGGCQTRAGGSPSNTGASLAELGLPVTVVAQIGVDLHGDELIRQWAQAGMDTSRVIRDPSLSTSVAVLPVYEDGGRGCWVDLSANDKLDVPAVLAALATSAPNEAESAVSCVPPNSLAAVHVGYPHLLRGLQGTSLYTLLDSLAQRLNGCIFSVDVNGVTTDSHESGVLQPALPLIDLLHANLEEARILAGSRDRDGIPCQSSDGQFATSSSPQAFAGGSAEELAELRHIAGKLHHDGVAIVAVTLGARGAYISVHKNSSRLCRVPQLERATTRWSGMDQLSPAPAAPTRINANGAGDAFTAGVLASLLRATPLSLEEALLEGQLTALRRISVDVH